MRNKLQRTIIIFLQIILLYAGIINVHANNVKTFTDFNNVTERQCKEEMIGIVKAIIEKNTKALRERHDQFTNECLGDLVQFTSNMNFRSTDISEIVVDYTTPNNSSTGDTVIMINIKLQFNNYTQNEIYLFELHVNVDGDIYGYNIWHY